MQAKGLGHKIFRLCCFEVTVSHLLMQLEHLLLSLHISSVHVVAAHLVLILEQQLSVCHSGCVLDVLEVPDALQPYE